MMSLKAKSNHFFQQLKQKGLKKFLFEDILESNDSNKTKALSVALGVFIGMTPLFGFHTILVFSLAFILKLNKAISFLFTHISFPLFLPVIIYCCLKAGNLFIENNQPINFDSPMTLEIIKSNILQYLVGSLFLGTVMSLSFGLFTYFLLNLFRKNE